MLLQQAPELEQGGGVGDALALAAEVDADEAAQRWAVEQGVFARLVGQVEPVLH